SFSPVWKCHRCFPFRPSSATKCPSSSPKNTNPPAVDTVPAHESALPVMGYSHLRSPVFGSNARRKNCPTSCGLGPAPPPEKFPFGVGSLEELVYTSHCSRVTTYSRPMSGLKDGDIQLVAPCTPGQTRLPVGVGSLPGTRIGRPFASIPDAQSNFSTSRVAFRYSPVTRSST